MKTKLWCSWQLVSVLFPLILCISVKFPKILQQKNVVALGTSILWRGSFSDAVDKHLLNTLIQKFVFPLILCKAVKSTYLNIKCLPLHTVLHVLWIHLSMMLLTSCFSIPWLLICLLAPSDLWSMQTFMSRYIGGDEFLKNMNF